ncbi:SCP2 sterol-binding domain-containing protein [Actinokineospora fastidiosa]|uniref:Sterol-binding protein n=1 Tax=Actinokineospora fastidiosa TaxID=1816 RepID=A0A918L8G8_9PSEU|nr:SCP2 sterol-binding domain-containing protein [Actinokineospora fastidiosa]GGS19885.1 sterol-binding protein [Actinokineospora fastidiosa]
MRRTRKWHRLARPPVADLDAFAELIDPARLTPAQFVDLVSVLDMLGAAGTAVRLSGLRTETFVRFLDKASREQIEALMAHPHLRYVVFDELFQRMSAHLDRTKSAGLRAVVHWQFPGGPHDDGIDRFETRIREGRCVTGDEPTADPRVTLTVDPVDFLRVITGSVNVPMLFLSGKVKVKGDIAFAATLIGYFDLPR